MRWLVAALLVLVLASPALAEEAPPGRVLLFLIDQVDWTDLKHSPSFVEIAGRGSVGLLHTGSAFRSEGYSSIGMGARSKDHRVGEAFGGGEPFEGGTAEEAYVRRGGRPRGRDAVYHLGFWAFARENASGAPAGGLGSALVEAGIPVALLANSDTPTKPWRPAVIVAMDEEGVVERGEVSAQALLEESPEAPFGIQANIDSFLEAAEQLGGSGLLVVDTGDTARVRLYEASLSDSQADFLTRWSVNRAMQVFVALVENMDLERDMAILLVPGPSPKTSATGSGLTPIVILGRGFTSGFLMSPSTRREGVVLATDIAPTILEFYGIKKPKAMTGRPVKSQPRPGAIASLGALEYSILLNHGQRSPLIKAYIFFQIAVLVLATAWLFRPFGHRVLLQTLLLGLTIVPLSFLIISVLELRGLTSYLVGFLLPFGLAGLLRSQIKGPATSFALVALVTVGVLLFDQALGLMLTVDSPLGHSTVGGARFFGLGNEYAGVLLGASVVGFTAMLGNLRAGRRTLWFLGLLLALVVTVIGLPTMGANFGGSLSAAFAASFTVLSLWHPPMGKVFFLFLALAVFLALTLVVAADWLLDVDQRSHVGMAVSRLVIEGPSFAWEVYSRKMSMNLRLLRYTIWSRVLVTSLVAFGISVRVPKGVFGIIANKRPALLVGIKGAIAGSLFAMITNDSGVVAAATTMIFASTTLLSLALEEIGSGIRPDKN